MINLSLKPNLGLNPNYSPALQVKYSTEVQEVGANRSGFYSISHLTHSLIPEQKASYSDERIQNLRIYRTRRKRCIPCLVPYGKQTTESGSLRMALTSKCDISTGMIPSTDTSVMNIHGSDSISWNLGPFKPHTTNSQVTLDPLKESQHGWYQLAIRVVSVITGLKQDSLIQHLQELSFRMHKVAQDVSFLLDCKITRYSPMLTRLTSTDSKIQAQIGSLRHGLMEIGTLLQEVCLMIYGELKNTLSNLFKFLKRGELTDPSIGDQHDPSQSNDGQSQTEKRCLTAISILKGLCSTSPNGTDATANRTRG